MSVTNATHQLPPHLLAPYVAAGAREVLDGHPLSDRSKRAVEEAVLQLRVERAVIERSGSAANVERVAALATASNNSLQLAVLALEAESASGVGPPASPQKQLERSPARLDELIRDLEGLAQEDPEAAGSVTRSFGAIVNRLFAGAGQVDISS
ncbi:MAG: hypothetical protein M3495_09900 [Pseudomonadota bacterium]|nr:hypothetical protein [Gammaproteobacteria bacterium]MDQ3581893.1 hypothetical protein [Pseudomonadota bacterium]